MAMIPTMKTKDVIFFRFINLFLSTLFYIFILNTSIIECEPLIEKLVANKAESFTPKIITGVFNIVCFLGFSTLAILGLDFIFTSSKEKGETFNRTKLSEFQDNVVIEKPRTLRTAFVERTKYKGKEVPSDLDTTYVPISSKLSPDNVVPKLVPEEMPSDIPPMQNF